MSGSMQKVASWLAIGAMALQALWPLIAQARPATLVPVCTVGGETHYAEVPGAPAPADSHHCQLCVAGAALPCAAVVAASDAVPFISPDAPAFSTTILFPLTADARAPPVLPMVHSNHSRRTESEEALALRAARPDLGGGVLRFRVLHG